jgi:amino acid adenylation domain-containing protein
LSYGELNERANRLAHYLMEMGVGPETLVGVLLERSVEMVVGILGILKAGGAYVPLDPGYPKERLAFMVADSAPVRILASRKTAEQLSGSRVRVVVVDDEGTKEEIGRRSQANPGNGERRNRLSPGNAAYVIYTSGSTGRPKAVVMSAGALSNLLRWHAGAIGGAEGDRVAQFTALSFDVSVQEILGTLMMGKVLCIPSDEVRRAPHQFFLWLEEYGVNELYAPTLVIESICQEAREGGHELKELKKVVQAGEVLRLGEDMRWLYERGVEGRRLHNHYGPTETHVATAEVLEEETREWGEEASIGRPIGNVKVYVLDEWLQPVPVGVAGELYIGGRGLARGYLKRPDLASERFIANPFGSGGERSYRTGDLVKWQPNGSLVFLGRVDDQVKIRGFRIELREIEAVMKSHPAVAQAVVIAIERRPGEKQLAGYVVSAKDEQLGTAALIRFLATQLPEYMVPVAIVQIPEIPLTPNGKLDKRALPAPKIQSSGAREPRTPQEEILCGIFARLLNLERVGIDENFFELGGHSLLAARVVSKIRSQMGMEIEIRELFTCPTVARLAAQLGRCSKSVQAPLVRRKRPERVPLSYAQQRLWFLYRLEGPSATYNIPVVLRMKGRLEREALREALRDVVVRHESLRTVFPEQEGVPEQKVVEAGRVEVGVEWVKVEGEGELERELEKAVGYGFELEREIPMRVWVYEVGEEEHVMVLLLHHIAGDGWSLGPLGRDLREAYGARRRGEGPKWRELSVQYGDYTVWQREVLGEEGEEGSVLWKQMRYWRGKLEGMVEEMELMKDGVRPAVSSYGGGSVEWEVGGELHGKLVEIGRRKQASLFMVLHAGLCVLLGKLGGGEEVVVGTPVAGRRDDALEDLVGFFVNTLVLRVGMRGGERFGELVERVREEDLNAYANQDVPFERLVEDLNPTRYLGRHPLFQVMLLLQNNAFTGFELPGLEVRLEAPKTQTARFDLLFSLSERRGEDGSAQGIAGEIEYATELYERETVKRIGERLVRVLERVAEDVEARIGGIDVLTEEERRQIVEEWNGTKEEVEERTLAEMFEEQVERNGERKAVMYGGEWLSYGELNERANRLAHYLMEMGVGPETLVGVLLERSAEVVVSQLAILKAGGAYVPLDPEYPKERLAFIIADSMPVRILASGKTAQQLPASAARVVVDDEETKEEIGRRSKTNPGNWERRSPLSPGNAAYIVYTSGSTGKPKGVVIEHGSLINLVVWHCKTYNITPGDRATLNAPLAFDASVWELWPYLCAGAGICIPTRDIRESLPKLLEWIDEQQITISFQPSPLIPAILEPGSHRPASLRVVVTGSDKLRACPHRNESFELVNHYGPTECTVIVTAGTLRGVPENVDPHIGKPISNTQIYVLDNFLHLVPVGVAGELYIAGTAVGRAYLKRAVLTAERFVADPYAQQGGRMYRTGDLARWRMDGNLEFLGRTDDQVKIRGFRIELGEIEAVLRGHPGISQAVVVLADIRPEEKELVAYVVGDENLDLGSVRRHMEETLPKYMVPKAILRMKRFPLTPNNKVDKRALPVPDFAGSSGEYHAPRTPEEEILCGLFAELLGLERIGIEDNFFELGGHSLMATRLVSRIRTVLGAELAIRTLFESPTVGELSERLRDSARRRPMLGRQSRPEHLPLSYAQQRLWFIDQLEKASPEYNMPEALWLRGELDRAALERAVNKIVERHESLRTNFGQGSGVAEQKIEEALRIEIPLEDLSGLKEEKQRERLAMELRREWEQSFDLARGPVLRMKLLKLGEQEHILLANMHHIASDGWSFGIFHRELRLLYEAYSEGRENPLPPLTVQYADFALWQREWLEGDVLDQGLTYWKEKLSGIPKELQLPRDRPRPILQSFAADVCSLMLEEEQVRALKRLGQNHQATLYMTLLAGFAALLARYSGQEDIVVGSPIANRQEKALEDLIGFFVNSLLIRTGVGAEVRFGELLHQVRQTTLEAYQYQDVPFERVVEELNVERSLSRTPVFQVMFALQNAPVELPQLKGLDVSPVDSSELRVRFDLEVHAYEHGGQVQIGWLYNRDLFDGWRIEQMGRHYARLLAAMVRDEGQSIWRVELLGPEERQHILEEWNRTEMEYLSKFIHELFEDQAEKTPQAPAVVYAVESVTYRELNKRANRLAHFLVRRGIGPGDVVGLAMQRSLEMVPALLGILKSGAAYLPLDLEYPKERLAFMLENSGPVCVLTTTKIGERLPQGKWDCVRLDATEIREEIERNGTGNLKSGDHAREMSLRDGAYVIYTSGSTGNPKGTLIEHRSATVFLQWARSVFSGEELAGVVASTSICFDLSIFELFVPLSRGGRVILVENALQLANMTEADGITLVNTVPSAMSELVRINRLPKGIQTVNLAGEALERELVNELYVRHGVEKVFNLYGPTEDTTYSTYGLIGRGVREGACSIGKATGNTRVYVLDRNLEPVAVGITGELYLGGLGLARGYQNQSGLTAERFVADPHSGAATGARMYRTGDLVKWRRDGNLEFIGRADQQVKVRGYRVELGEIEALLREHPAVQDAVVLVREITAGEKQLVGYVVRQQNDAERARARTVHIEEWRNLYQSVYEDMQGQADDFNITGWESSYTGEPIPAEEMRMWTEETVRTIKALNPKRVVEIGCGTGLLLTRLAGDCEKYLGLDFSKEVLEQLKSYVATRPDLKHVELREAMAHELSFLKEGDVDLVILNSVAQYFPDVNYLLEVLGEAVRITQESGHIFVGDVRSLSLLEAYHTSVQLHKAADGVTPEELRARVGLELLNTKELVIDPKLFVQLGRTEGRWKKISRVEISLKGGDYNNELNRFRYDVTMRMGLRKEKITAPSKWIRWDESGDWKQELRKALAMHWEQGVGVSEIPDQRVAECTEAVRLLQKKNQKNRLQNAGQLRADCAVTKGEDPHTVMELARRLDVRLNWQRLGADGIYDAIFAPHWEEEEETFGEQIPGYYEHYANRPSQGGGNGELGQTVREYLGKRVPEYMVPGVFMVLHRLPLTANGKVDRNRLPAPDYSVRKKHYRAHRTPEQEILCSLFAEVLGAPSIGVDDDFFELGGHSLMATRLVSRVREVLGVEVMIRTVFEAPNVAMLAARLYEGGQRTTKLERGHRPDQLPLSYAQQRLWFIDQLESGSPEYNMPEALRLRGNLDVEALRRAINTIVERHESLRTHFEERAGEPVQVITERVEVEIEEEELIGAGEEEEKKRIRAELRREQDRPFDLSRGPLFRMKLLKLGQQEHVLLRTTHHIVFDGWSHGVFNRELMELYAAYQESRENPLEPLEVQYADFALWQRSWLEGGVLEEGLNYWKKQLNGIPEQLELPADRARPLLQTFGAEVCQVRMPAKQAEALLQMSRQNECTLYMSLLAAFAVLLSRYSGQDDIVLGSPIANRQDAKLEKLIGFFVNTLVMRVGINEERSFRELLREVRRTALEAYRYQDVPFERIVEELNVERSLNRTPVFQVMFALQNVRWESQQLQQIEVQLEGSAEPRARFDLAVHAYEHDGALAFLWVYKSDLFDRWRMEQMARHYLRVLEEMAREPVQPIGSMELLGPEERRHILQGWNETRREIVPATLPELFEKQAEWAPHAMAVVCGKTRITYSELNQRCNQLAHFLVALGVDREAKVAIYMGRSEFTVIATLAVLKAGGTYVPLDLTAPTKRVEFLLDNLGCQTVLTECRFLNVLPQNDSRVIPVHDSTTWSNYPARNLPERKIYLEQAAYVLFTSGSTGLPKGVVIEHRQVVNYLAGVREQTKISSLKSFAMVQPLSVDSSVTVFYSCLTQGGCLHVIPEEIAADPAALRVYFETHEIDCLKIAPSHLAALQSGDSPERLVPRHLLIVGGEESRYAWLCGVQNMSPNCVIFNHYGPTETTVGVLMHRLTAGTSESHIGTVPVGTPLANTRAYVLDSRLRPSPPGVTGELYIAGSGLGRGYLNMPGVTAERYVADPHGMPGTRMYRTGDLVRRRPDGNVEFLGRSDSQVKIRGFRIELGEIEAAFRSEAHVQDVVVMAQADQSGDKRLIAYVVANDKSSADSGVIRKRVEKILPEYMVPAAIEVMEKFPRTPHGKLDRKALPVPEIISHREYRAPQTAEAQVLCQVVSELLGKKQVGLNDNFFELGGHSLLATRLANRLRTVLGVELHLQDIFVARTLEGLSATLTLLTQSKPALQPNQDVKEILEDTYL